MTDNSHVPIRNAVEDYTASGFSRQFKAAIIADCVAQSDVANGFSDSGPWEKIVYTMQDDSSKVDLICWGDNIGKFKVGYKYHIVNGWWKEWRGKVQLDLGNYGQITVLGKATNPCDSTIQTNLEASSN